MNTPPLTAERILEALSAKTVYRDGILGDLAEEFALHAELDGPAAARRWYYRESLRATPHLLRDWGRSLRARDVRRLANVVFASYIFTLVLLFFLLLTAASVTNGLRVVLLHPVGVPGGPMLTAVTVTIQMACYLAGGYIAASIDNTTPLISALALGVSLASVTIALSFFGPGALFWYRMCLSPLVVAGTAIGGLLQVHATRLTRRPAAADSPSSAVAS